MTGVSQDLVATSVQQTLAAMSTSTASLTAAPSNTYTPEHGQLTLTTETNCRSGPGTVYPVLGIIFPGQVAVVLGKSWNADTYIVQLPSNPAITCWVWANYATVTGNTSTIPVFTPPPSPTPAIAYSVSYLGVAHCAPDYFFRFGITNTGSLTWESIRISVTDNTSATTFTHTNNAFRSYNGCGLEGSQDDLMTGESAVTANINPGELSYNPAGHSITAIFHVCSADGLGDTCQDKTLNFTP